MADLTTTLANLINPQVMADMISAKMEKKIVVTPFARLDTTLQGNPGDTVTVEIEGIGFLTNRVVSREPAR